MVRRYSTNDFVLRAKEIHGDKYDYSLVNYTVSSGKVTIRCNTCGCNFEQVASDHLHGKGCPNCAGNRKMNTDSFIKKAMKVHGTQYDYSKVNYINNHTGVVIICPVHGEFVQLPQHHLNGSGCPKCNQERNAENRLLNTEKFVLRAKQIHGDKYGYDKVVYKNSRTKVLITCPLHGDFYQMPSLHLRGAGCMKCAIESRRKEIRDIWMDVFNERFTNYHITSFLLEDGSSCVYLLENGQELRITVNKNMYDFSKELKNVYHEHLAIISDCFKAHFPDERGGEQNVFCIIGEKLNRSFQPRAVVQAGINLFRDIWIEYLKSVHRLDINPYVSIEEAYVNKDYEGIEYVKNRIREIESSKIIKDIAYAFSEAFAKVKMVDQGALIYWHPDNIGMSEDNIIKICNIGHRYRAVDENHDIDYDSTSVTVTYDPILEYDDIVDMRLLIPVKVNLTDTIQNRVVAQIDTGAFSSAFTTNFYESALLQNLGDTVIGGVTGKMESVKTKCEVEFPNGFKTTLDGVRMRSMDDVSILIGMDFLSKCEFHIEPYKNGMKYKITFPK